MKIYFAIANKFNIVDKPNHRSAHTEITLRGGGIIFWLSAVMYEIIYYPNYFKFIIGLTIICAVSFWDDIKSLSNRTRMFFQFIAISIVIYSVNLHLLIPFWGLILTYILIIGTINAYNFMDGINGITGLYSLAILISLAYVNYNVIEFVKSDFIIYPIIACLVFLFFNFRKKAKCFAGDIGSIGIAFWIIYLLLLLMLKSNNFIWILFLIVYGGDTGCTILYRMYLKENIFVAHRHHFYQLLCNDFNLDHRYVAVGYAILQLFFNQMVLYIYETKNYLLIGALIIPTILIYSLKFYFKKA